MPSYFGGISFKHKVAVSFNHYVARCVPHFQEIIANCKMLVNS